MTEMRLTQLDAIRRIAYVPPQPVSGSAIGTAVAGGTGGGSGGGTGGGSGAHIDLTARALAQAAYNLATTALQPDDVATAIHDGDPIDLQDRDGTLGETSGALVFGAASEDMSRARPLRVTEAGLAIDQRTTIELLRDTLNVLEEILERRGGASI